MLCRYKIVISIFHLHDYTDVTVALPPKDLPKVLPKDSPKDLPKELPKDSPVDLRKDLPKDLRKDLSKDAPKDLHVELEITQTMGFALLDGYRMHLTCSTSKSNNTAIAYVDMRWSGMGLRSLWVKQSEVKKQNDYIERKLFFEPWLDQHAGEYTCHLTVKVNNSHTVTVNKTIYSVVSAIILFGYIT